MQSAYLIGSLFLFVIWLFIFLRLKSKDNRAEMIKVSLVTSLLGLTEPIFVPEYWNPPTFFGLAQKTGFDIESLIFAFAVGGIAVSAYESIFKKRHLSLSVHQMHDSRHKVHFYALIAAPLSFTILFILTDLNLQSTQQSFPYL